MYPSDASRMPARASGASHLAIELPTLEECSHCHEMKLPHHVCPNCGYYHGRLAVQLKPSRRPTTPRADAVTEPQAPARPHRGRRGPRRGRRDGRRSRSVRGRPGRARPRPRASRRPGDPGRRRGDDPRASPASCPPTSRSSMPARSSGWTSIRPWPCARRRTRRSSSRSTWSSDGEADAVVTAGHTGAGMAAAVLRLGRLPGVDRPALAVQMITDAGPDGPARHRRQPRLDAREPRPVRADGRDLRRARPRRRRARASRCCRSARRRARATPGSSAPPSCSTRPDLRFEGNVEGKDLTTPPGRRRRLRRGPGQRRDQVLRGPLDLHLRPVAGRVLGLAARAARVPADAAGRRRGSGTSSTTRRSAGRRCSACAGRSSSPTAERSGGWSASPARWRRPTARTGVPAAHRRVARGSQPAAVARPVASGTPSRRGGHRVRP